MYEKTFTKWGFLIFPKMPKCYYFVGFLLVKNRSAAKCLLNRGFLLFCRLLNRGLTVLPINLEKKTDLQN